MLIRTILAIVTKTNFGATEATRQVAQNLVNSAKGTWGLSDDRVAQIVAPLVGYDLPGPHYTQQLTEAVRAACRVSPRGKHFAIAQQEDHEPPNTRMDPQPDDVTRADLLDALFAAYAEF